METNIDADLSPLPEQPPQTLPKGKFCCFDVRSLPVCGLQKAPTGSNDFPEMRQLNQESASPIDDLGLPDGS